MRYKKLRASRKKGAASTIPVVKTFGGFRTVWSRLNLKRYPKIARNRGERVRGEDENPELRDGTYFADAAAAEDNRFSSSYVKKTCEAPPLSSL
jgi:hypothetical protein